MKIHINKNLPHALKPRALKLIREMSEYGVDEWSDQIYAEIVYVQGGLKLNLQMTTRSQRYGCSTWLLKDTISKNVFGNPEHKVSMVQIQAVGKELVLEAMLGHTK
jgi:hypothetical protein